MTSNYWASTQCNEWLLSRSQLALARAEDLEYAVSADELFALRIWLTNCISSLTKKLALRQRVTATAIIFFHRFYSCAPGNSFSSTDPALVATACVYVAAKVEEAPLNIRNVAHEAAKHWTELGHSGISSEIAILAEMEFYLLEDLHFHLIIYHPYRSLVTIAGAAGKGALLRASGSRPSMAATWSKMLSSIPPLSSQLPVNRGEEQALSLSGIIHVAEQVPASTDTDLAFGNSGDGLTGKAEDSTADEDRSAQRTRTREQEQRRALEEAIESRQKMLLFSGDNDMPLAQLEELDEQVLQMAWFVLNDAYRTDVLLLFPPHLVAVAALFLALVLHDSSREKMLKSKRWMDERRSRYYKEAAAAEPLQQVFTKEDTEMKPNKEDAGNSPSPASPLKQKTNLPTSAPGNGSSNATPKLPLRGLASLPPRPSHLPPKPSNNTSNPATPVGTPITEPAHKASPDMPSTRAPEGNKPSIASMPVPPPDAMTFLASLNVDLNAVGEIMQELISLYEFWSREGQEDGAGGVLGLNDSTDMLKRLNRMREARRLDLMQHGAGW